VIRDDHLIFGVLSDKSIAEMAQIVFPLFDRPTDRIHLVSVRNPRAASLEDMKAVADSLETPVSTHATVAEAIAEAQIAANATIVIAGSLYLVAEARALLLPPDRDTKA